MKTAKEYRKDGEEETAIGIRGEIVFAWFSRVDGNTLCGECRRMYVCVCECALENDSFPPFVARDKSRWRPIALQLLLTLSLAGGEIVRTSRTASQPRILDLETRLYADDAKQQPWRQLASFVCNCRRGTGLLT